MDACKLQHGGRYPPDPVVIAGAGGDAVVSEPDVMHNRARKYVQLPGFAGMTTVDWDLNGIAAQDRRSFPPHSAILQ
jgi:hypothetical protein